MDVIAKTPKYAFDTYALPTLLNSVDLLLPQSPAVQEIYEAIGVDSCQFSVAPNYYDPSFGPKTTVEKRTGDKFNLLYIGSLSEHKAVDILIDSIALLERDDLHIHIAGDGNERAALERQATELDVADLIRFHGFVDHDEVSDLYRNADVFVHPGRWPEPFCRTILEAMQYGCPAIVSDVGGPPWAIGDAGLVFPRDAVTVLADRIETVVDNERRYHELRQAIPERLEQFSPSTVVDNIVKQYQSVLESSKN